MENFQEKAKEDKNKGEGITRREFLKKLGLGVAGAAAICSGLEKVLAQEISVPSRYEKRDWYYTLDEMKEVYEREYNGEKILKNVFEKKNENISYPVVKKYYEKNR